MSRGTPRKSARARGYSPTWDKAAATFKRHNPLCLGCRALGKSVPTELVDHVEPHKGDVTKFWNVFNWQPSCRWHHDVIKPRLEALFFEGTLKRSDLWLNSTFSINLSRQYPGIVGVNPEGWPQ